MNVMNVQLAPGKYIVAVSGGVDSVVLLHALQLLPGLELTVAHFDHGMRSDSAQDAELVARLASRYGLDFVRGEGRLGSSVSEAAARTARYEFLHEVRRASGARAVVTAHHQDDVLETAILNILRGTGRLGLTSLRSTDVVARPLLEFSKQQLRDYARQHRLEWREDSTNASLAYRRNYVRHRLLARFSPAERARLLEIIEQLRQTNRALDELLAELLAAQPSPSQLRRYDVVQLPHAVARELLTAWFRRSGVPDIDSTLVERAVHAAKTYQPGRRLRLRGEWWLCVKKDMLFLEPERPD